MKASKLVYNCNGYNSVNTVAQVGIEFSINNKKKFFGLEEWNNNKIIKDLKIGYLDSFRTNQVNSLIELIWLFSYYPTDRKIYLVGYMKNVRQLECNEIYAIRKNLNQQNWLNIVHKHFQNVNDDNTGFEKYKNCWISNDIIAKTEESFLFNLKYEKLYFLNKPINLLEIYPEINKKWKWLKTLYSITNLPIEIQEFILKQCK